MKLSALVLCIWLTPAFVLAQDVTLSGKVTRPQGSEGIVRISALPLQQIGDERFRMCSKEEFFRATADPGDATCADDGTFALTVKAGAYCVYAFADTNDNGRWDPAGPEPMGWYATQASGHLTQLRAKKDTSDINFTLQAPTHFSEETATAPGGVLRQMKGYTVLQLSGDAQTRGYAHGKLVAPQIVDFFRFYILEEKFRSASAYEQGFAKFLNTHFAYPQEFVTECKAVIAGMQDSGANLFVPELGRNFSLTDLYAINGYIETRAMRSSCTQFAAWGERTEGTDVSGGMITGRNMDGEIDLRRVTVSHFLLFAVDPDEPGQKRYVSMMWPGFVATISGFNEDGFYTMENAGLTGPGGVVDKLVPFSWAMRESLAKLGSDATPESVQQLVDSFDNAAGGSCGPGCVTLFAVPYTGQETPAFILEGDRFGDAFRRAEDVEPRVPQALVGSNHHRVYGVEPATPNLVFGREPSFSSLWRYEAGKHKLASWYRTGREIGTPEMQELLQTVAHGTTEYAIITRPNVKEFDVSVASMKAEMWDAPYREWTTFTVEEMFEGN